MKERFMTLNPIFGRIVNAKCRQCGPAWLSGSVRKI